ncbi:hypothetical protein J3A83DRAFT_4366921 [Scleroderma citrinum]
MSLADNSYDAVMLIVAFFIIGILISRMIEQHRLSNSPSRVVRFRPHVDDLVAMVTPEPVSQYAGRGAQQHAVSERHRQTTSPPYSNSYPSAPMLVV